MDFTDVLVLNRSGVATVAVVLVWGSQCLAFIRYRMWFVDRASRTFGNTDNLGGYEGSVNPCS